MRAPCIASPEGVLFDKYGFLDFYQKTPPHVGSFLSAFSMQGNHTCLAAVVILVPLLDVSAQPTKCLTTNRVQPV